MEYQKVHFLVSRDERKDKHHKKVFHKNNLVERTE